MGSSPNVDFKWNSWFRSAKLFSSWKDEDIVHALWKHSDNVFTTIGIGTSLAREGKLIQKYVFKTRAAGFGAKKEVAIFPEILGL